MSEELTRLEESQAITDAATDGPWNVSYCAGGNCGGKHPNRVCDQEGSSVLEDEVWMSSEDAEFIAHSRTALPRANAALLAVLKIHRKVGIYSHEDECENHNEEHRQERHHEYSDMTQEFFCEDLREYWGCAGCYDAADLDTFSGWPLWPCPTVQAIQQHLEES